MSENQDDITDQEGENEAVSVAEVDSGDNVEENADDSDNNNQLSAADDNDADNIETSSTEDGNTNSDMEISENEDDETNQSDENSEDNLITLEASMDHEALNDLTQKILAHFKENDSLELNISALEDVNTACVQAFISINRYAKTNDKSLKWISPSSSFVDSFNTLGLYSEMMQMEMA